MRKSLVWRIAIPFILLILLSLGGLSLYFANAIEQQYYTNLHDNLATDARLLAKDTTDQIAAGKSYEDLAPLFEAYAQVTGSRVTFIRTDGVVTNDTVADPKTMDNHLVRPEVRQALDGKVGWEIRFSDTLNRSLYFLAVPVTEDGKIIGVVRLARDLVEIENAVASLNRQIWSIGILTILITVLLAFLVAGGMLRPLRQLVKNVRKLKDDRQHITAPTNRRDEIGQLARAFAELADQLNTQVTDFQEERGKLEAVLQHMTDAILIVDADGKVTLVNPAAEEVFKLPARQAVGRTLVEVARQYQFVQLWKSSMETGKQQLLTLETTPDRLFVQAIATPLEASLPGSTLMTFQDLTRVRRLETVRRDFVSNVSHELRTPLASLKALAETLQTGALEDPAAAKRFLKQMEIEIDNLTQMVQEFLDLSRIESGRATFNRQPIDPHALITRAVERMALQAERSGLTIDIEDRGPVPSVNGDAKRIESVLTNLLHNAIKFTPPGGKIIVTAYQDNNEVVFSIQDTGVGIAPDDLARIFERFYKADQSRSGGGTGLGLSIARHTVEVHGGRIWAESAPGQGSIFYFSLPLA